MFQVQTGDNQVTSDAGLWWRWCTDHRP